MSAPTGAPAPTLLGAGSTALSRGTFLFVGGSWVAMFLWVSATVIRYTRRYPFADELQYMGESITPHWLWEQHAEHRIPLAKLIWLGVLKLTNYQFRAGNLLSVIAVAAVAFALIRAATRLRGSLCFSDAFFPLCLLSFGQTLNFMWWWQVNHLIAPVMASCLLLLILMVGSRLSFRLNVGVGVYLLLFALSGPGGLPYVLAGAVWLVCRGVLLFRSSPGRDASLQLLLTLGLAAAACLMVGLYFIGYSVEAGTVAGQRGVARPDLAASLKAALQLMSVALGPATRPHWALVGTGVLALLLLCAATLGITWYRRPEERVRAAGLLLLLGAMGALFLAVGRARAGLGEEYIMQGHYLSMAAPALCLAYFVSLLYAGSVLGPVVQVGLFAATCLFFPRNAEIGLGGVDIRSAQEAFERDLRAGMPPLVLAERHLNFLNPSAPDSDNLRPLLMALHRAGVPQFRQMRPDPQYRELPLPPHPAPAMATEPGDGSRVARLTFDLGQPRFVYAIRVKCVYGGQTYRRASFRMAWEGPDDGDPPGGRIGDQGRSVTVAVDVNPGDLWSRFHRRVNEKTLTIWVNDAVSRFSVFPDDTPSEFKVSAITLFLPAVRYVPPRENKKEPNK